MTMNNIMKYNDKIAKSKIIKKSLINKCNDNIIIKIVLISTDLSELKRRGISSNTLPHT